MLQSSERCEKKYIYMYVCIYVCVCVYKKIFRDLPGSPVIKPSPSNVGGLICVQSLVSELRSYMPLGQKNKTSNWSNIVSNLKKTFKICSTLKKQLKRIFKESY